MSALLAWALVTLRVAGPLVVWVIRVVREIDEGRWRDAHPGRSLDERPRRWLDSPKDAADMVLRHARRRRDAGADPGDPGDASG